MSVDREIRMSLRLIGYSRGPRIPCCGGHPRYLALCCLRLGFQVCASRRKPHRWVRCCGNRRGRDLTEYGSIVIIALLHVRRSVGTKRGCDRMHLQTCSTAQRRRSKSILLFCVALRCTRRFVRVRAESTIAGANEGGATGTTLPCPNASTETPTFRHQTWPILVLFVCCSP